ncbi:hypothetical protein ACK3TF_000792 [Chlorella vulgaris]
MHGAVDGRAARGEGCRQGFARHANAWQGARACDASAHCAEVGYQRPKDLWRSMRAHCNPQTGNLRCSERSRHAAQLPQFGAQAVMGRDLGRFNYRSIKGDGIRSAGLTLMQVGQPISAGLFGQTAQMLIASLMPRMHCTVMEAPCDVTQHALIIQRYGREAAAATHVYTAIGSRVPASQRPVAINAGPLQPADREFAVLRAQQARRAAPAVWRTSRHGP